MDKTILITGASRGLGKELALIYASPGNHLILLARDALKLEATARQCAQKNASVEAHVMDVRDTLALKNLLLRIDAKTPIDLIIANAGIARTLGKNWHFESDLDIEDNLSVNLLGAINTVTPILEKMIERKHGQIVFVSSMAALRGLPHSPSYCASKAAIQIYGQSLRAWLSRYNIKVSTVFPGYIKTDMSDNLNGPKLFVISSSKAAKVIKHGVEKNKAKIVFPWQIFWLMKFANALPSRWVDFMLNRFEAYANERL